MNFGLEDETLEFKKTTSEINEATQSICAMLNKHGYGTIYFGVLPNGEVEGQMISDSTLRDISRKIFESIVPQVIPNIKKMNVEDKEIIEVTFKGNDKPYSCRGIYYIRIADEDRILQPHELRQLFEYNKVQSWDSLLTNYDINDIDIDSLKKYYNKATACKRLKEEEFDVLRLLNKLNLIKNGKLTNAAHLLFSKENPIVLKMAIFATNDKLTFLDINRQTGNIITLIEEANTYVKKNIRWKADIVGSKRVETPEIPLDALREIICNSFAHARYDSNTEHEISIHPGMIRIYNPGEFPIGYKPEDFINSNLPSMIRNPLILKTLFLSDDVESYSSGFKRVYEQCNLNDIKIEYVISRDGFTFIFKRNEIESGQIESKKYILSDDDNKILELIKNDANISINDISICMNKSTRTIQRNIKNLKDNNIIDRVGKTKGYWIIK